MATNPPSLQYRLTGLRSLALPLVVVTGAFAALPLFGGLPLPNSSRAPSVAQPTPGVQRFSQEVLVANVARGCRWQHSPDPAVQIADCGDENESVRVVFQDGRVTEYRVMARPDPSRPTSLQATAQTAPPSGVAGIASVQQPSQPGRVLPNNGAPLRVTVTAGS